MSLSKSRCLCCLDLPGRRAEPTRAAQRLPFYQQPQLRQALSKNSQGQHLQKEHMPPLEDKNFLSSQETRKSM